MKLVITTAAAALISTAALADQSDRYNDQRLDTGTTAEAVFSDKTQPTDLDRAQRGQDQRFSRDAGDVTFSTRSDARTSGEGYLYGGFGDGNDSR